jgi:hypothetical protein
MFMLWFFSGNHRQVHHIGHETAIPLVAGHNLTEIGGPGLYGIVCLLGLIERVGVEDGAEGNRHACYQAGKKFIKSIKLRLI